MSIRANSVTQMWRAAGQPIVFDGTASPVKNVLFAIICCAWILPGLIGHDPWKPDEALAFGVIYGMLRDGLWLVPHIVDRPYTEYPPLYYWSAAITAKLFSPILPLHDGARLASGLWMAITLLYLHKTAQRLLDIRAGRICVVLLLGSLGLILRAHEINPEVAGLAGCSIALYGLTRIRTEARRAGVAMGIGGAVIALSIGLAPAVAIALMVVIVAALLRDTRNPQIWRSLGFATLITTVPSLFYVLVVLFLQGDSLSSDYWWRGILALPWVVRQDRELIDLTYVLRILPWYALPTLPFALWLWRTDRAKVRERIELALPLGAFLALLLVASLFREARDAHAMCLLLPLALAAASVLDRLPRGLARFVDWLSLLFCGLIMTAAWLYWGAAITGTPEAAARAVARQVPDFEVTFSVGGFVVAALFCLIWLYAVAAAHRNNRRALVNWSAGITLIWVLLNLLMLPAIDHVRSYRTTVAQIRAALPSNECVREFQLGDAQRAMLYYFEGVRVVSSVDPRAHVCRWVIAQGVRNDKMVDELHARLVWEGARPGDFVERLRVLRIEPFGATE